MDEYEKSIKRKIDDIVALWYLMAETSYRNNDNLDYIPSCEDLVNEYINCLFRDSELSEKDIKSIKEYLDKIKALVYKHEELTQKRKASLRLAEELNVDSIYVAKFYGILEKAKKNGVVQLTGKYDVNTQINKIEKLQAKSDKTKEEAYSTNRDLELNIIGRRMILEEWVSEICSCRKYYAKTELPIEQDITSENIQEEKVATHVIVRTYK